MHRDITINGDIDADMDAARRQVRQAAEEGPGTIRLLLNSAGGAVNGAFALVTTMADVAATHGVTFEGLVEGRCASAATLILQGCQRRICGRYGLLMVEGGKVTIQGSEQELLAHLEHLRSRNWQMARLLSSRTEPLGGRIANAWHELLVTGEPWYLTAHDARAERLIDQITGTT